jgi:hypothetical protein
MAYSFSLSPAKAAALPQWPASGNSQGVFLNLRGRKTVSCRSGLAGLLRGKAAWRGFRALILGVPAQNKISMYVNSPKNISGFL